LSNVKSRLGEIDRIGVETVIAGNISTATGSASQRNMAVTPRETANPSSPRAENRYQIAATRAD
jgi:hypothetical protein